MERATRVPAMGSRGKVQRRNDLLPFFQEVELNQPTGKQQEFLGLDTVTRAWRLR
jgi:hypothetical protein